MAGLPWFLLAGGIGLVILGAILAGLPKSSGRDRRVIDADMRDDDIVRELRRAQRVPMSGLIFLTGVVCILASLGWRLARYFS